MLVDVGPATAGLTWQIVGLLGSSRLQIGCLLHWYLGRPPPCDKSKHLNNMLCLQVRKLACIHVNSQVASLSIEQWQAHVGTGCNLLLLSHHAALANLLLQEE